MSASPRPSPVAEARAASRALAAAAFTTWTLARFEAAVRLRGLDGRAREDFALETMRVFGEGLVRIFGIDLVTEGLGPDDYLPGKDAGGRGRVFFASHRSGLDILITLKTIAGRHVSRADLASWPLIGTVANRAGILFVDRTSKRSSAQVMRKMIECVETGKGVIIFPEGTTFAGDEVRPLKAGAFSVARRTGAELVPVGIAYEGDEFAFDDDSFVAHMRRVSGVRRVKVALVAGEPFVLPSLEGARPESDPAGEIARERLQVAVNRARALLAR